MVEPIASGEVFPNVVVKPPVAPKHTAEGHERCAYPTVEGLECEHGLSAGGSFYSEDYIKELKPLIHRLIGFIDLNIETKVVNWSSNARIERKYMHAAEISDFRDLVETLRELTK